MGSYRVSLLRLSLLAAVLAFEPRGDASSLDGRSSVDPRLGSVFQRAHRAALARLSEPSCQAVLHDFDDARTGRPAAETLAATGLGMPAFFESLTFVSSDERPSCRDGSSLARTPVGAPVVFVCSTRFQAAGRVDPGMLVTVLIHESLHSLGVGEDPPSSEEITFRVQERCGR